MEQAYDAAAAAYGFRCTGCVDNCCLTRFYHHTLLEYLYLYRGYADLPVVEQDRLQKAAAEVNRVLADADERGASLRSMCPLNLAGRCRLYRYRPMICRLHGIPNELRPPGGSPVQGPGCGEFGRQCGHLPVIPFDRTPLYGEMARGEKALRADVDFRGKTRLTVAEMIVTFPVPGSPQNRCGATARLEK